MQNQHDNLPLSIGKTAIPPRSLCRPVRSAKTARKYLAMLLAAYQRGEVDSVNAKTSTYVLSEYLRATEASGFEERLDVLEKKIKNKS